MLVWMIFVWKKTSGKIHVMIHLKIHKFTFFLFYKLYKIAPKISLFNLRVSVGINVQLYRKLYRKKAENLSETFSSIVAITAYWPTCLMIGFVPSSFELEFFLLFCAIPSSIPFHHSKHVLECTNVWNHQSIVTIYGEFQFLASSIQLI